MERITAGTGTVGRTCQEQNIGILLRHIITVCHVYQIIFSVIHMHNIPHMSLTVHPSCHGVTDNITSEGRQIAQILECLGIALADYLCLQITVKYVDQLPWISVGLIRIRCEIIIRSQIADPVLICL